MTDRWQDDPDLFGTAIDKVVRTMLRTPISRLPEEVIEPLFENAQRPISQQRSSYAVLASVCRVRVLAVCRGDNNNG